MYNKLDFLCVLYSLRHYQSISYPTGRTASGFAQKLAALKKTLKPEIDAINSGQPVPEVATSNKNGGGRKRKVKDDDANGEYEGPKKRGRAKKKFNTEVQEDVNVKDEPDSELEIEVKI
jgi:hypothetical protein